ncbi:MAG: CDP-glycerol glycerophosphotransferase family protein [Coprococcus sp.]|jgi:CDP-ribitol ribitolphosphotransferase|uniref:CDP-glycerol glycerophosphotransferase family protein n=1 Tax=Clostridium sp. AF15-41 TaxID=2292996 RepID=UPI00140300AF|nr:CDP-glycerol glycerophosphotransferase family protein [Clostridium sp. AF15-41]MED9990642.1 CDP-glycerol glycerophosphotransferase family protein [Coprococcus sp.]
MKMVFYIKQVLKMAMQQIYLPLLYKRYAGKPVEKGLVIFADAHHEELPFSMKKMYETLQWDPEYKNETWVTDFGKMGYGSLLKWLRQFMKRYAVAEYVFICDNFLPVSACEKRPETKVVQLWHSGGLLKKSGYDTTEDIPKMYKGDSVYKNYDLLTVSAPCCVPVFTKTMRLASGVVQATGISRSDYYYDDAWNQANYEEFYRKYPEAKGKKVILWAPTFRGNAAMPTLCGMEEIQRVMKETEDRYYWVIKLHPHLEEKGMKSNCDLPSEKIFAVADLLITDYSSILFDYMAYKKPFLFFAPDFDSFDHARGFYVPYDSFPCKVVTDGAGLPAAIEYELSERDPAEIEKCFAYHMSMCDGKATERILKTIKQITHNASSQI